MSNSNKTSVVSCKNLNKYFGDVCVVSDLSFEIEPQTCFGLIGPNGAGKTTTLRMLLGQSPRSGGMLEIFGSDIDLYRESIRVRTGIVPQLDNLDPDFTVKENLQMYGSYFRIKSQEVTKRIPKLLDLVELTARADDKISTLSGGMKRRLTLARALVNDPELLVLDEPTTGLDPQARHMLWSLIHQLRSEGKTILLTTHYMEEAERLCDELMIIDHGELLVKGSPKELTKIHCETDVLEIHGKSVEQAISMLPESCRYEKAADSIYIYSNEAESLIKLAASLPNTGFSHRHAGLEDVFLRLTGRKLRG